MKLPKFNPLITSLALVSSLTWVSLLAADDKAKETAEPVNVPVSREENPDERRVRLLKNFEDVVSDLTPEQKTKLLEVLEPTSDAIRAVRKDGSLTNEEYRTCVLKLHEAAAVKVDKILTEPQRVKWQKSREEKRRLKAEKRAKEAEKAQAEKANTPKS